MTEFTQEQYREVLASIASGLVVRCEERNNADDSGLFKTLYINGFIQGQDVSGLNWFRLLDIRLTATGRSCLAAFDAEAQS